MVYYNSVFSEYDFFLRLQGLFCKLPYVKFNAPAYVSNPSYDESEAVSMGRPRGEW